MVVIDSCANYYFAYSLPITEMTVTVTLNNVSLKRDIPTSWDQVTFRQFLELEKCGQDIIKVIALFTSTDYDTLRRSKIHNMDQVIAVLGFLREPMVNAIPKTILGYPVPENLEFGQVQQFIDLKNYVQESAEKTPREQLESYTLYCAVYACPSKHKEYDWKLVEAMRDEFLEAPCTEVMGIGNFTLARLVGLKHSIDLTSRRQSSLLRKLRLALVAFKIRMVLSLRSFSLRKKLV